MQETWLPMDILCGGPIVVPQTLPTITLLLIVFFMIEGISKVAQYAYSKRVLFIDKEGWGIPYSDIYDRGGELWKIWINDVAVRKKAFDGAGAIEYEDEMGFAPAIVMVDMQLEHATRAALPSHRFPGEQGWYFNQGEDTGVTEDWFTVAALVAAGH